MNTSPVIHLVPSAAREPLPRKNFFLKFVPADWRSDPKLRACSLAARGLWIEMIGLMHESGGYLLINAHAPSCLELARQVGATPREVKVLLEELRSNDVSSVTEDGIIYCRRMVRAAQRSTTNADNGRRGSDARWGKGATSGSSDELDADPDGKPHGKRDSENDGVISLLASKPLNQRDHRSTSDDLVHEARFARVQKEYPTKVGKQAARKAWGRLKPRPDDAVTDHMIAAIERQKRTMWSETDPRYIPHLSTWLNNARWEDELPGVDVAASESDLEKTDRLLASYRGGAR